MNRRGIALLLVLWLLVLLTGLAATTLGTASGSNLMARNRMTLLRAGWAREACLEILMGRYSRDSLVLRPSRWELNLDSVDLGDGVWCSVKLSDPGEQVNLNLASEESLRALLGDSGMVSTVVRGRPWPAVDSLPPVFNPWKPALTVRGDGRINLTTASRQVLATLPGSGRAVAQELEAVRRLGRPNSTEELMGRLPPGSRESMREEYESFLRQSTLTVSPLIATVEGRAPGRPVVSRVVATLVPAGARLAVVRRESE